MMPHPPSPTAAASVQVVIRLRPLNQQEKKHGTLPVVSASTADKTVTVIKGQGPRQVKSSYKFDNVFTAFSSQEEVFEATLQPVIRDVLMGFESTVFAYGQTGTGKTHTMEGDLSSPEMYGVIPRSAASIFDALKNPDYESFSIAVSFLEIYNEDLCDLLVDPKNPQRAKLNIMEGKNGPFCRGLSETNVTSTENVLTLMRQAQQQRQVGETNMNKQSSRSHCIFTLKVKAKRKIVDGSILEVSGKLHCVDLAGSECAKTAEISNEHQSSRERERLNINRSLLTLGRVVSMLKEHGSGKKKNVRIPYRDSKLTRILQESLGGRCKTCLIATVSPSVTAIEESMSTLNYAHAANGIVNKPVTSSFMSNVGSSSMSIETKSTSGGSGDGTAGTIEHWHEMECRLQYMQSQVEEAQQALARKHLQQQDLVEKAELAETVLAETVAQYEQSEKENVALKEEIEKHLEEKRVLATRLSQTEKTLQETTLILKATQQTETCLTQEAQQLLGVLKQYVDDGGVMHQILLRNREEDLKRKEATRGFNSSIFAIFENILQSASTLGALEKEYQVSHTEAVQSNSRQHHEFFNQHREVIKSMSTQVNTAVSALNDQMMNGDGIFPSIQSTSSKIRQGLESLDVVLVHGQDSLLSSCGRIQEQLTSCSKQIKDTEQRYDKSSTLLLETLVGNVQDSKESLSNMVASVTASLARAREARSKCIQVLQSIADEWKSASLVSADKVRTMSSNQSSAVEAMLQLLSSEVQRHGEVEKQLLEQHHFLKEKNSEHLGDLQTQSSLLSAQQTIFASTRQHNDELCQTIVSNVMGGVQELLRNQMALMTKQHADDYTRFASDNQQLVESNQGVRESAKTIFDKVASVNSTLQSHAQVVRENERQATAVLDQAKSTFGDIQQASKEQACKSSKFAETATRTLAENESADAIAVNDMAKKILEGGETCGTQLSTCILEGTKASIDNLSRISSQAFTFVHHDLIAATKSSISDTVEQPSKQLLERMKETLDRVSSDVDAGEQKVHEMSLEHCNLAESMKEQVLSTVTIEDEKIDEQKLWIEEHQQLLLQGSEKHEKVLFGRLSECTTQASDGKDSAQAFTVNVIRANEETPVVDERNLPDYCDDLTSTPASDVILKTMDAADVVPATDCSNKENEAKRSHVEPKKKLRLSAGPVLRIQVDDNSVVSRSKDSALEGPKRRSVDTRRDASTSRPKRVRTKR